IVVLPSLFGVLGLFGAVNNALLKSMICSLQGALFQEIKHSRLVKNSGFTSAASPSVVFCIVVGSPLLHLYRHPSSTSPSASLCCFSNFLPSNLLSFNPH
ncbi:hypothetical protein ES319_A12G141500v1, partial [Gossypium barbadense]